MGLSKFPTLCSSLVGSQHSRETGYWENRGGGKSEIRNPGKADIGQIRGHRGLQEKRVI